MPVLFGAGIATYFAMPSEPGLVSAGMIAAVFVTVWALLSRGLQTPVIIAVLSVVASGYVTMTARTATLAAPVLAIDLKRAVVTGVLERIEPKPDRGPRLTLSVTALESLPRTAWPKRVRIRLLKPAAGLAVGDTIRLRADLSPPMRPLQPGAFDFARYAFFQQIGATGFSFQVPVIVPPTEAQAPRGLLRTAHERLMAWRSEVAARVKQAIPGDAGVIATALITGERSGIPETTRSAYRDAGLSHLLVISGLHMMIVTGTVFLVLRFLIALFPTVASRLPSKKWAACLAAVAATAFLLMSGTAIATVRAYVMVIIMLIAVLMDRPAIALRNVAIAAMIILAVRPESLLDIGFQMSFAAVVALVATYEFLRDRARLKPPDIPRGSFMQAVMFVGGIAGTTMVASIAIAPIAIFHFHQNQQLGILANVLVVPLFNIAIMPLAIMAVFAMPLGLEAGPLWLMGKAIDVSSGVAVWVSGLSGAVVAVPAMPWQAFALMVGGGLWLALWRGRLKLWGVLPVALGLALAPMERGADVLIGAEGSLVATRDDQGALQAFGRRGAFELSRWLERDGDRREAKAVLAAGRRACDQTGCVASVRGLVLAAARHPSALTDDCAHAALLIASFRVPEGCRVAGALIDRRQLRDRGNHAIYVDEVDTRKLALRWIAAMLKLSDPTLDPGPTTPPMSRSGGLQPLGNRRAWTRAAVLSRLRIVTVDDWRGQRPWVLSPADRRAGWAVWRAQRQKMRNAKQRRSNPPLRNPK
ncbi:MAG: ComEC/Rec2 family competence protein [Pseudomonadota bacterium]